jgi:hypothetical protein
VEAHQDVVRYYPTAFQMEVGLDLRVENSHQEMTE